MSLPSGVMTMETAEFRKELEDANDAVLRSHLRWYVAVRGGIGIAWLLVDWINRWVGGELAMFRRIADIDASESSRQLFAAAAVDSGWVAIYIIAGWLAFAGRLGRADTLRLSLVLVFADGLFGPMLKIFGIPPGAGGIPMLLVVHSIAAFVFPWTPWQAMRPVLLTCAVIALRRLFMEDRTVEDQLIPLIFLPLTPVPGTLIAWLLHSRRTQRYRYRFLRSRYGRLRQELAYAQQIHESLFPQPTNEGPIWFRYRYEPMRQLGGDFLFARAASDRSQGAPEDRDPDPNDQRFSLVMLDVTGHGIPAALTVNRLCGELELLFAENPAPDPGEVVRALNRYVHLTLARHSIYVTGFAARVDPDRDTLEYANAGHPPAFLRGADGTVRDLESTAFVLGACPGAAFDPNPATVPFHAGDSLIAYTDGATEARNGQGKMLTIDGLRNLVAGGASIRQGDWPDRLHQDVELHRDGPAEDDTLLVELFRPLRVGPGAEVSEISEILPGREPVASSEAGVSP